MSTSPIVDAIGAYLSNSTWKSAENANSTFSHPGLMQHIATIGISQYWLQKIYDPSIREAYEQNRFHIHDLGFFSSYCSGWSIEDILRTGFGGVPNKIQCRPPKHLNTALNQIVNFLFTLQGELAGAQAISNFDTYLAPFVRHDKLSYDEVFKYIQSFVYSLNVPTRSGFQSPFTNISLDLSCPKALVGQQVIIGGEPYKHVYEGADDDKVDREEEWTYDMFQEEMDIINRAFTAVMCQGDGNGSIFSFPIPTYNITQDFDWEDPKHLPMWEMTAKYGIPYFANFVNSDLNPEDFRSMCCRLRLDTRKLHVRGGGLFGATPLTGSIGVVTLNLPNLAMRASQGKDAHGAHNEGASIRESFREEIRKTLCIARDSLEIKRATVESHPELYPYASHYLDVIKRRTGRYWTNHFSTIGIVGMEDAIRVISNGSDGIESMREYALSIMDFIKEILQSFQDETGNLYNLEATPAESTSYKLAQRDRELFPEFVSRDLIPQYYTNSTALPVDATDDLFAALRHQESLQCSYTGGTVFHAFLGQRLSSPEQARDLVRKITSRFRIPYLSLTPTFSICPMHGYINGEHGTCPKKEGGSGGGICNEECLIYSRIVGYYRPVRDWNKGKKSEFANRTYYKLPPSITNEQLDIAERLKMPIGGYIKHSAIDWPGKDGPVLFLAGCNLACPWCQNGPISRGEVDPSVSMGDVIGHLLSLPEEDRNLVVSGGEPTIHYNLIPFLQYLKEHNVRVKLDTNGTRPDILEKIISKELVSFIAMDIKGDPENYGKIAGLSDIGDIREGSCAINVRCSAWLIKHSWIPHQFRITVVPGLVDVEDISAARELADGVIVKNMFKPGQTARDPEYRDDKLVSQLSEADKDKLALA